MQKYCFYDICKKRYITFSVRQLLNSGDGCHLEWEKSTAGNFLDLMPLYVDKLSFHCKLHFLSITRNARTAFKSHYLFMVGAELFPANQNFKYECSSFIVLIKYPIFLPLVYIYIQIQSILSKTWWNANIFRVTGPLCGEFTGHRWIPAQRPVTRSFDVFFDLRLIKRLSTQSRGWWFETPSRPLWRHKTYHSLPTRLRYYASFVQSIPCCVLNFLISRALRAIFRFVAPYLRRTLRSVRLRTY